MSKQAYLATLCIGFLLVVGACSAGSNPVSGNAPGDLTNYASSVEGYVHQNGGPVAGGWVYVYDLKELKLFNQAAIGSDGGYVVGINEGQYLMFAFGPAGWRPPELETDFSSYVNIEADMDYRLDIELDRSLPDGEELVFGFVTSSENQKAIGGATVSAGGRSAVTDGYGFYAMTVPSGTTSFTVTAPGFYNLNKDIREGQANDDYFDTPFFDLNPTNTIGSSLGGAVRDVYDGTGLGGVRVTLTLPADPMFGPIRYLTNLGGEYRFFNLEEGIYKIYLERPGYASGTFDGLVIKGQDEAILNVFMHRVETGRASVFGYVNSAGVPLPVSGARVALSNPLLGSYLAFTNPTGYYRINSVVPANYSITVAAPGMGVTFYEAASSFQTIVTGDNRLDFALRYIQEGVLRGNVTIAGGGSGLFAYPPAGVEVAAEKVGGTMSGIKFRTTTDGQGIFVFNGIPQGVYKVEGRVEYETTETFVGIMFNVMVNAGTTTVVDLQLAPV